MPLLHSILLCVVLIAPGASLSQWANGRSTPLQNLLATSTVALVNVRTAERDRIAATASCLSIGSAARLRERLGQPLVRGLGYPALAGNLAKSLSDAGVAVAASEPLARDFCYGARASSGAAGELVVEDLSAQPLDVDRQIALYAHKVDSCKGLLIVVSPNPSPDDYARFERLTPIILHSPGRWKQGLAYSRSTRTAGLITAADIAPTIADYFHVPLQGPCYGFPLDPRSVAPGGAGQLLKRDEQWAAQEKALSFRWILPLAASAAVAWATWVASRRRSAPTKLLVALVAVPLVLTMPLPASPIGSLTPAIAACAAALLLAASAPDFRAAVTRLCLATAAWLLVDAIGFRGALTASSLLGYSPIEGARYYGIGNEIMGVWLGASVIAAAFQLGKVRPAWLIAFAVAVALCLGHPSIGAKAGGFIAALLTIAAFWWAQSGRPFKFAVAAAMVLGLVLMGAAALLLLGKFGESHVTQSIEMAHREGGLSLMAIIVRKAAMNAYLAFHSAWSVMLLVCVAASARLAGEIRRSDVASRTAALGAAGATAASFAFNDAGVVAAALCALYLWAAAYLMQRNSVIRAPIRTDARLRA